jgi:hypothetical protein
VLTSSVTASLQEQLKVDNDAQEEAIKDGGRSMVRRTGRREATHRKAIITILQ